MGVVPGERIGLDTDHNSQQFEDLYSARLDHLTTHFDQAMRALAHCNIISNFAEAEWLFDRYAWGLRLLKGIDDALTNPSESRRSLVATGKPLSIFKSDDIYTTPVTGRTSDNAPAKLLTAAALNYGPEIAQGLFEGADVSQLESINSEAVRELQFDVKIPAHLLDWLSSPLMRMSVEGEKEDAISMIMARKMLSARSGRMQSLREVLSFGGAVNMQDSKSFFMELSSLDAPTQEGVLEFVRFSKARLAAYQANGFIHVPTTSFISNPRGAAPESISNMTKFGRLAIQSTRAQLKGDRLEEFFWQHVEGNHYNRAAKIALDYDDEGMARGLLIPLKTYYKSRADEPVNPDCFARNNFWRGSNTFPSRTRLHRAIGITACGSYANMFKGTEPKGDYYHSCLAAIKRIQIPDDANIFLDSEVMMHGDHRGIHLLSELLDGGTDNAIMYELLLHLKNSAQGQDPVKGIVHRVYAC